jgi:hypothetical protein
MTAVLVMISDVSFSQILVRALSWCLSFVVHVSVLNTQFSWPCVVLALTFPLDQRFAISDPAKDDGCLRAIKIHSTTSFGA